MSKIEELKAAYKASTSGEWERSGAHLVRACDGAKIAQSLGYVGVSEEQANLKFAALAHNLMPALLEAAEALENLVSVTCYPTNYVHVGVVDKAKGALAKLKGETP